MSMPDDKPEYPPLLPIGRHDVSLKELRALCLDPFSLSATRGRIMAGLEVGHPDYWVGQYMQAYWMRQWGFSRGQEFKGIAVLHLPKGLS
jgi:hypothetical protein